MRNQPRFIQDSISGISNTSIHFQGLQNQSLTELQSEQTDHLVSEILKGRAERLMRHQREEHKPQQPENVNTEEFQGKTSVLKGSVTPIPLQSGEENDPTELKRLTSKHEYIEDDFQQLIQEGKSKKFQSFISESKPLHYESNVKNLKKQLDIRPSETVENEDIQVEPLINQTRQEEYPKNAHHQVEKLEIFCHADKNQKSIENFELPKVDKINNQSIENSVSNNEQSLKFAASMVPFQPASDYLEIGMQNSRKSSQKGHPSGAERSFVNQKDKSEHNNSGRAPMEIEAVQSKITVKPDASLQEIQITQRQNLRKQTDQEVVQALTDRLNQINQIQEAEIMENLSKRRQSQKNPSFGVIPKTEDKPISREFIIGSQFETEYSEDIRDVRILEHHYESNIQSLQDQVRQLVQLHEALILEEECIESRRKVKDKDMENRRCKIKLRNASYSKRFNYHSPIPKNNNVPLQFFKKFKVSPRYEGKYNETTQQIEKEKKIQGELQDQYRVFCRFYQLMKSKQISSYPELPLELQYDAELQKFAIKGGFLRSKSPNPKKSSRYEFNKSNRTVNIDETQINYHDLLNYKKDISRDAILEFEVFNLGRIKKLKDQNKLLQKQIEFINQQIEEVNIASRQLTGEAFSCDMLVSANNIKSKTSFSRSPIAKTKTFYKLTNYVSPMERVARNNREMSNSQNKLRLSASNDHSKNKLKLTKSKEPRQIKRIRSPMNNMKKNEVIEEIEDDYGLSELKKRLNHQNQIPTFGQRQSEEMVLNYSESQNRMKSPSVRKKNFIEINKKLSTRTELNTGQKKDKILIKRLDSEKLSPIKKITRTEPSISVDQSNGFFGNFI